MKTTFEANIVAQDSLFDEFDELDLELMESLRDVNFKDYSGKMAQSNDLKELVANGKSQFVEIMNLNAEFDLVKNSTLTWSLKMNA